MPHPQESLPQELPILRSLLGMLHPQESPGDAPSPGVPSSGASHPQESAGDAPSPAAMFLLPFRESHPQELPSSGVCQGCSVPRSLLGIKQQCYIASIEWKPSPGVHPQEHPILRSLLGMHHPQQRLLGMPHPQEFHPQESRMRGALLRMPLLRMLCILRSALHPQEIRGRLSILRSPSILRRPGIRGKEIRAPGELQPCERAPFRGKVFSGAPARTPPHEDAARGRMDS